MMVETAKKTVPVVEKICDFSQEQWDHKQFTFVDGTSIRHLFGISPIVIYRAKVEETKNVTPSLNAFVKSIMVCKAKAVLTMKYEGDRLSGSKKVTDETFFVFETESGMIESITHPDLIDAFCKIPDVTVSPEGVLLINTVEQLTATTDLKKCVMILGKIIETKKRKVKAVVNRMEHSALHLVDEEGKDYIYMLNFLFNLAWRPMFSVQASFVAKVK